MTPGAKPHVAFCTTELRPFVLGGGIGRYVAEMLRLLDGHADVTVVAPARWRAQHAELERAGDPLVGRARFAWVEAPTGDVRPFISWEHAYADRLFHVLAEVAAERPIDTAVFEDYRGLGAVAIEAKRAGHAQLASTRMVVDTHSTWELTAYLDGLQLEDPHAQAACALERVALRYADAVRFPSRRSSEFYEEYYGPALAPALILSMPMDTEAEPQPAPPLPLKFLYVGRLQRLKGTDVLVEAFRGLDADATLTMVGDDTQTGPGRSSMRDHLLRLRDDDPRIQITRSVAPEEVGALISAHHVVVVPSRYENHGYLAREALAQNRPIVARDVGGLAELHDHPGATWKIAGPTVHALRDTLAEVVSDPEAVLDRIAAGSPGAAVVVPTDDDLRAPYLSRASAPADPSVVATTGDDVTILVTTRGDGDLDATLESLAAQDAGPPEVIVLGTGAHIPSAHTADLITAIVELPDAADIELRRRGLEVRQAGGPVVFLSAGQTIHRDFLGIALHALRGGVPYVTAYGDGRTLGNAPLSNAVDVANFRAPAPIAMFAADAVAEGLPEPAQDGLETDALMRRLAYRGRFGVVVPSRHTGPVR